MKIVILDGKVLNPGDVDWGPISALGETTIYDETPPELLKERCMGADVVVVNKVRLRDENLEAIGPAPCLVALLATGYDNVDIQALGAREIPVCNVVAYGLDDVAQHVMALLLEMCRQVTRHSTDVLSGGWTGRNTWCYWMHSPVNLLGLTIGIVGFGGIGRRVGEIAHAFGMNVLANCRTPRNPPDYSGFSFASREQIFEKADVITLHCPLTPDTREIINADSLAKMKDGAYLINTARGPLVNEEAVAAALRSGKLAGFTTDVLSTEPPAADNPILSAPNVIVTPHIAWASGQSRQRIINLTAENIRRWKAGTPINVVNRAFFPEK